MLCRPHWQLSSGGMTQMGAGSMSNLTTNQRPLCIHRANPVLTDTECRMALHRRVPIRELGGAIHDVFRCPASHSPQYYSRYQLVETHIHSDHF